MLIRFASLDERAALEAVHRRAALADLGDRALLAHPEVIELPLAPFVEQRVHVAERVGIDRGLRGDPATRGRRNRDRRPVRRTRGLPLRLWRALVEHCGGLARRSGSRTPHVIGNYHAQAFQEACGFTTTGTTDRASGMRCCCDGRSTRPSRAPSTRGSFTTELVTWLVKCWRDLASFLGRVR
jgi:hypothetical protein